MHVYTCVFVCVYVCKCVFMCECVCVLMSQGLLIFDIHSYKILRGLDGASNSPFQSRFSCEWVTPKLRVNVKSFLCCILLPLVSDARL